MTFQTNSYNEYLIPPYASSDMPPRRRWWSRPIVTLPPTNGRRATCKETTVCCIPFCGAIFTIIAVMVYLFHFVDNAQCDAKFAIQSIAVSPSDTWHVDFLVKNPSPRYLICSHIFLLYDAIMAFFCSMVLQVFYLLRRR